MEDLNHSEQNSIDNQQNLELKKTEKKVDRALIVSIIALVVSIAQLILTSPFFLDIYNQPNITVDEGENWITGTPIVSSNYQITNESNKTATNLILAIDAYSLESISFTPENSFEISDSIRGTFFFKKRYIFAKNNLIPNEKIFVNLFNHIDTIAKKVQADTLKLNYAYNCQDLVPHVEELKSDFGFAKIKRAEKYIIRPIEFTKVGSYKLSGEPVEK